MRHLVLAASALALIAGAAHAETLHFQASLNGASEVPPNATGGTGQVTAALDTATKTFTYTLSFSRLDRGAHRRPLPRGPPVPALMRRPR